MTPWKQADPWGYFWSQYLIWIVRFISYIANFFFLASVVAAVQSVVTIPVVTELLLLVYTGFAFAYAETFATARYRPGFYTEAEAEQRKIDSKDAVILTQEQYEYRTTAEKMMLASWIFAGFNIAIGAVVALIIGYPADDIIIGTFALLMATVFSFFAVISLTAKDEKTGERSILSAVTGLVFNIGPLIFIVYGIWRFFISVYLSWEMF